MPANNDDIDRVDIQILNWQLSGSSDEQIYYRLEMLPKKYSGEPRSLKDIENAYKRVVPEAKNAPEAIALAIARGLVKLPPPSSNQNNRPQNGQAPIAPLYGLAPRERQIVELVGQMKTNKEITMELGIKSSTLRGALRVIYKKLGLAHIENPAKRIALENLADGIPKLDEPLLESYPTHPLKRKEENFESLAKLSFGSLLAHFRNQCDRKVTQLIFATQLSVELGYSIDSVKVSNWERDVSVINKDDRRMLVALIMILHKNRGIKNLAEAGFLLHAGNYRTLSKMESDRINKHWLP